VEVGAGETARLDLDAESDSLGRLVVTLPEALSTVTVECSAIVDGKLRGRCGTFYREGQEFEVRGRFLFPHLPPGEYVVWSDSDDVGEAVRRCETRVRLDRGTTTELTMPAPVCSLVVPLELPEGLAASDVAVFAVQAYDGESALSSHGWTPWAFSARPLDGAIEVTGLPPKPIRCGLLAPGCPEAWSEPVNLSLAPRASSATARLAAGQPIRVRLVTATADSPPKEPSFRVYRREPEFRRVTFTAARQGDDLWSLSAFVPGTYEVRVSDMEYGSAEGTVTVGADSAAEITLEREP
jgi:hypothetical protein